MITSQAARERSARVIHYPNGHKLSNADRLSGRIYCCGCDCSAEYCEYSRYAIPTRPVTAGVAFWYYCSACWNKPGPSGTTPSQRAHVEAVKP